MTFGYTRIDSRAFDLAAPHPGDGTIVVTDAYTLDAGQTLQMSGSPGIKLVVKNASSVSVDVEGSAELDGGNKHSKFIGIVTTRSIHGSADVTIGETGSLYVHGDGGYALIYGAFGAVRGMTLTNAGLVHVAATGGSATALEINAKGITVTNTGTVQVEAAFFGYGAYTTSDSTTFHSSGTITVTAYSATGVALSIYSVGDNDGEIHATASDPQGIAQAVATYSGSVFTNTGLLQADGGKHTAGATSLHGVFHNMGQVIAATTTEGGVSCGVASEGTTVQNEGLISGQYSVIALEVFQGVGTGFNDSVTNSGKLVGMVDLGDHDDTLVNTGRIQGDVMLGLGNDSLNTSAGKLAGIVYGGQGADTLIGSASDDVIHGDEQASTAGDGLDRVSGLGGADTLFGGGGADTFVYTKVGDSHLGAADLIQDLESGDHIDLSAIDADTTTSGDQAFHLVGGFGGHAGELTVSYDSGTGLTTVAGDVNGDGTADLVIIAAGDHHDFTGFAL